MIKSRLFKYSILVLVLGILLGGITSCSNLFNINPFGSVTFTFSLPNHLRSSRAVNYSLKVSIYENNDTLIKSEEKAIEAQNTVIKFHAHYTYGTLHNFIWKTSTTYRFTLCTNDTIKKACSRCSSRLNIICSCMLQCQIANRSLHEVVIAIGQWHI